MASTLYGGKAGNSAPPPPDPNHGTNRDDLFIADGGDDQLYGGKGSDTLVLSGTADEYRIEIDPESLIYRVQDLVPDRDGHDTLRQFERLRFADGSEMPLTPWETLYSQRMAERAAEWAATLEFELPVLFATADLAFTTVSIELTGQVAIDANEVVTAIGEAFNVC